MNAKLKHFEGEATFQARLSLLLPSGVPQLLQGRGEQPHLRAGCLLLFFNLVERRGKDS